MILEMPEIVRKKSKIKILCDTCNNECTWSYGQNYLNIKRENFSDIDLCRKCWRKILNNRPEYKEKMSKSITKTMKNPAIRKKISTSLKGKNVGDKNGMTKPAARKKASESRLKLLSDPAERKKISENTKKAWADGKYDGVKVGKCKWYEHIDNDGNLHKLQGSYELKFAQWLDKKQLKYRSHVGYFNYHIKENDNRKYFPDFFVYSWDSYVEIKSDYHYQFSKEKLKNVIEQNKDLKLILLLNKDLKKLKIL